MIEIIYSSNVKKILRFDIKKNGLYFFISLDDESKRFNELLKLKEIKEINVEEISEEERKLCEKEYINVIADLGFNYKSVKWWANSVSEKNEHVSDQFKNLCLFYSLIKTLREYFEKDMSVFVICNNEIYNQLKIYCNQNNIKLLSLEKYVFLWVRTICMNCYNLLRIAFSLTKVVMRKIYISYKLGAVLKRNDGKTKTYYVTRTWLDNRFLTNKKVYHDAYFGKLPEYVSSHGYNVAFLAGIINNFTEVIKKIKNTREILIIPEESFLKFKDIFRLFSYMYHKKTKLNQGVLFNNLDVTFFFENEIARGYRSEEYLMNILRYLIAKRFADAIKFEAYIQTFENYAWEKMTILGISEAKPEGKIFGFQHAFISRNSFKYFPGEKEKDIIPLPDKIVTMGEKTKEIMERYGAYKEGILETGCALRQEYIWDFKPFARRRFNKVVIPLTMVKKESMLIMNFLHESGLPQTDIKVIIRCHPAAPFDSFKKYIDFKMPYNFIINNEKKVYEELSTTDIVLYTWTTVAVEALKLGLPIIYLDILNPMYVDPLFECDALKKSVKKPEELLPAIESFYYMNDDSFYKEQTAAQEYLKEYFYPVTVDNMASFIPKNN